MLERTLVKGYFLTSSLFFILIRTQRPLALFYKSEPTLQYQKRLQEPSEDNSLNLQSYKNSVASIVTVLYN